MHCLIVTDHCHHQPFDSVYLLARELAAGAQMQVSVVSLGHTENIARVLDDKVTSLLAVTPSEEFSFHNRHKCFLSDLSEIAVDDVDFVLLRLLPFNLSVLNRLKRIFIRAQFINSPEGIIATESKSFLLNVADLCPAIRLCSTLADVQQMFDHGDIVLKPLYGYGGKGNILLSREGCIYQNQVMEWAGIRHKLSRRFSAGEQLLAMEYLPDYDQGDKRILVVAGKIIGATLRLPKPSQWLCNISSGGYSVLTDVTEHDHDMVSRLSPLLAQNGIQVFGIDTLLGADDTRLLSEINTLCPGGFHTLYHTLQQPQTVNIAVAELVTLMCDRMRVNVA